MRVLITGTSTGIGLATALELGRAGHDVIATMRNPKRAPELGETAELPSGAAASRRSSWLLA